MDIWRIEWYVCFWPLWFSKPTIWSTVITFSSVRVCFSLPISCRWSVLHVSKICLNNIPTISLLQLIFKNFASIFRKLYFLNRYTLLIRALSPLLNSTSHHGYIFNALRIIIYDNIICFLFTHIRNVHKTKRNLIFVYKLVKIVPEYEFCCICIIVIFKNFCFTW